MPTPFKAECVSCVPPAELDAPDKAKSDPFAQCFYAASICHAGHCVVQPRVDHYCRSYSPLFTRFSTVNPAFFASETESGLSFMGELKVDNTLRTGFLHAGHRVNGGAAIGRRSVNRIG